MMGVWQLHQDGDCDSHTCPVCAQEDEREPTIVELIESVTGLNGETLIEQLAKVDLVVTTAWRW